MPPLPALLATEGAPARPIMPADADSPAPPTVPAVPFFPAWAPVGLVVSPPLPALVGAPAAELASESGSELQLTPSKNKPHSPARGFSPFAMTPEIRADSKPRNSTD